MSRIEGKGYATEIFQFSLLQKTIFLIGYALSDMANKRNEYQITEENLQTAIHISNILTLKTLKEKVLWDI